MADLDIKLLGAFAARPAAPMGRKTQALLAVVALAGGQGIARDKLIGLLWSDRGEAQARASLRQALTELRQALGDAAPALVTEGTGVRLDAARIEVDAMTFERLVTEGSAEALAEACALYRGDLLDGCDVRDAAFEDWLRTMRERLRGLAVDAHRKLMTAQTGDAAIATARRLLALDPLDETAHRALMRAYAASGNRAAALKQYQACRDALKATLDTEPEPETTRLNDDIREGRVGAGEPSPSSPAPPAAALAPDRPTIAVLPFTNMSGDPDQEYFSDGITEDIITELSRFREFFVLARNSSFTFKGQAVDVTEVGRRLGVGYVVEGSVRKAANRVRVTAQLVEAATGNHLWAERYDRELTDIFAVQDELVRAIASTLPAKIDLATLEKRRNAPAANLSAYDHYLRARALSWRTTANYDDVVAITRMALDVDPSFAPAHALLAQGYIYSIHLLGRDYDESLNQAHAHIDQALAQDDNNPTIHAMSALAHIMSGEHELARIHADRAYAMNPNDVLVIFAYGLVQAYLGHAKVGVEVISRGDRVHGFAPDDVRLEGLLDCCYMAGDYEKAIATYRRWRSPVCHMHAEAAAAFAQLGRMDEARAVVQACFARAPKGWNADKFVANHARMCARDEDKRHWLEGYRKAGVIVK